MRVHGSLGDTFKLSTGTCPPSAGGSHASNSPPPLGGVEIPLAGQPTLAAWCSVTGIVAVAVESSPCKPPPPILVDGPVPGVKAVQAARCVVALLNPACPTEYSTVELPLQGACDGLVALAWSPPQCRRVLLAASRDGSLSVWDQLRPDRENVQVPSLERWWGQQLLPPLPGSSQDGGQPHRRSASLVGLAAAAAAAAAAPRHSEGGAPAVAPLLCAAWLSAPSTRHWDTAALLDPQHMQSRLMDVEYGFCSGRHLVADAHHWVRPGLLTLAAVTPAGVLRLWWTTHSKYTRQLSWHGAAPLALLAPLLGGDCLLTATVTAAGMAGTHAATASAAAAPGSLEHAPQLGGEPDALVATPSPPQQHGALVVAMVLASQRDAVRVVRVEGHPMLAATMGLSGLMLSVLQVTSLVTITLPAARPAPALAWRPSCAGSELFVACLTDTDLHATCAASGAGPHGQAGGTDGAAAGGTGDAGAWLCRAASTFPPDSTGTAGVEATRVQVMCYQAPEATHWLGPPTGAGRSASAPSSVTPAAAPQADPTGVAASSSSAEAAAAAPPALGTGAGAASGAGAAATTVKLEVCGDGSKLLLLCGRQVRTLCCQTLQVLDHLDVDVDVDVISSPAGATAAAAAAAAATDAAADTAAAVAATAGGGDAAATDSVTPASAAPPQPTVGHHPALAACLSPNACCVAIAHRHRGSASAAAGVATVKSAPRCAAAHVSETAAALSHGAAHGRCALLLEIQVSIDVPKPTRCQHPAAATTTSLPVTPLSMTFEAAAAAAAAATAAMGAARVEDGNGGAACMARAAAEEQALSKSDSAAFFDWAAECTATPLPDVGPNQGVGAHGAELHAEGSERLNDPRVGSVLMPLTSSAALPAACSPFAAAAMAGEVDDPMLAALMAALPGDPHAHEQSPLPWRGDPETAATREGLLWKQQAALLDALRMAWSVLATHSPWDVWARVLATGCADAHAHTQRVMACLDTHLLGISDPVYKLRLAGLLDGPKLSLLRGVPHPGACAVAADILARRFLTTAGCLAVKFSVELKVDGVKTAQRALQSDEWLVFGPMVQWAQPYSMLLARCVKKWVLALQAEAHTAAARDGSLEADARAAAAAHEAELAHALPCIRLLYDTHNACGHLFYLMALMRNEYRRTRVEPPLETTRTEAMLQVVTALQQEGEEALRGAIKVADAAAAALPSSTLLDRMERQNLAVAHVEAEHSLIRGPYRLPPARPACLFTLPMLVSAVSSAAFTHIVDISYAEVHATVRDLQLCCGGEAAQAAATAALATAVATSAGGGLGGTTLGAVGDQQDASAEWLAYRPLGPTLEAHVATLRSHMAAEASCSTSDSASVGVCGRKRRHMQTAEQQHEGALGGLPGGPGQQQPSPQAGLTLHTDSAKAGHTSHGGSPLDALSGRRLHAPHGWAHESSDGLFVTDELATAKLDAPHPGPSAAFIRRGYSACAPVTASPWRRVVQD